MRWEYYVVHLNVEDPDKDINISNPDVASEKLKGSLSADFIKSQFPDQYKDKETITHPATQLSNFLNEKGKDNWELFETVKIGNLLFLIMKRQVK